MTTTLREDWRAVRKGLQGVAKGLLSAAGAAVDGRLAQLEASIIDGVGAMFVSAVEARRAPISEAEQRENEALRVDLAAARETLGAIEDAVGCEYPGEIVEDVEAFFRGYVRQGSDLSGLRRALGLPDAATPEEIVERARAAAELHEKEVADLESDLATALGERARLEGEAAVLRAQIKALQAERRRLSASCSRCFDGHGPMAGTLSIDGRLVRRLMGDGPALDLAELEQLQRHLDAALAEVVGAIDEQHQRLTAPTVEQLSAAGAGSALLPEDLEADLAVLDEPPADPADEVVTRVTSERVAKRTWLIEIAREILHHHGLGEGASILRRAAAALGGDYPAHTPVHAEGWASCVARARQLQRRPDAGAEQAQRREDAA